MRDSETTTATATDAPPPQASPTVPRRPGKSRLVELDILRGIAILLVLGAHLPLERPHGPLGALAALWHRFGWTGVDLFFVLSGFLVGGLLLGDLRTHGRINVKRFLVRRGFKIWPAYYVFLIYVTIVELARATDGTAHALRYLVPNWLHLQNYLGTTREITWSLAVEEHFYLVLPWVLVLLTRKKQGLVTSVPQIPVIAVGLIVCCTLARWLTPAVLLHLGPRFRHLADANLEMVWTHTRLDGLFLGVMLAYFYHFQRHRLEPFLRHPFLSIALGSLLVSPMLFVEHDKVFVARVLGLTALYLGFACILLGSLHLSSSGPVGKWLVRSVPARATAFIGFYSYSIYLWHIDIGHGVLFRVSHALSPLSPALEWAVGFGIYVCAACGGGILMGRLVEMRMLRLRDRFFPHNAGHAPNPQGEPEQRVARGRP